MVRDSIYPIIAFLLIIFVLPCQAQSTTVSAKVDRNPVAIDESVTYLLEIQNPSGGDPDFTPLETDFEIISQSSSTNMQIINGARSHSKQYHLSLIPKRIGKLTIPPVSVGKYKSNAVELMVTTAAPSQGGGSANFMLDVRATPESPYVGEQVLVTVRLYIGASLVSGSLSEPSPNLAEVTKLGEDREFTTSKNGRNYRVNERRYVLFPQQPGTLTIPPIVFQGQTGRRSSSLFDPFSQAGPVKRIRSKELRLDIRPKPQGAPLPWLPTSSLSAAMELSQPTDVLKVGEPVTLDLTIKAKGLNATLLPEPEIQVNGSVRTYPDQPSFNDLQAGDGIASTLVKKITVIATEPGQITITPKPIGWWNTTTDELEDARFKPLTIEVLPGAEPAQPEEPVAPTRTPQQELKSRETALPPFWGIQVGWFWVSIVLACCWVATLIAWRLGLAKKAASSSGLRKTADTHSASELEKQLKNACSSGSAKAAKECVHQLLGSKVGKYQEDQKLQIALAKLNDHLYSPEAKKGAWNGAALWSAYQAVTTTKENSAKLKKERGLAPLYDKGTL